MSLPSTAYPNNIRTVSGLNVAVFNDDSVLEANTSTAPVSINLNPYTAGYWSTQYKLYIIDGSNNASTNNITINAPTGYKVNGQSSVTIPVNGGGCLIRILDDTNYIATFSFSLGAGGVTNGANVGTGVGQVFKTLSGTILQFKTLKAGTNITITNNADDITIDATGGGGGGVSAVTASAPITSSGGTTPNISTSMSSGKLIGRSSAGTGTMEEITLGGNISLSGGTLNVQAYSTIQDEGSALPQRTIIDFVGAGVTATDNGSKTIVTINGGGGGGVIPVTNAGLNTLINTNAVVAGQQYLVSPVNYVNGAGVIVTGTASNGVSSSGIGNFLNADYQKVGNYSGVTGYTATIGIWDSTYPSFTIGDVVIWNNGHYQSKTGATGTDPSTDTTNWLYLSPSVTNGYIPESDYVIYDSNPLVNAIVYREDKRENKVDLNTKDPNYNTLLDFQWGRDASVKNSVLGKSVWGMTNCQASIIGNFCYSGECYSTTTHQNAGTFVSNTIKNESVLSVTENQGSVIQNVIESYSSVQITTVQHQGEFTGNTISSISTFSINVIGGLSYVTKNVCSASSTITFLDSILTSYVQNNVAQSGATVKFVGTVTNLNLQSNNVHNEGSLIYTGTVTDVDIKTNFIDTRGSINIGSSSSLAASGTTQIISCSVTNEGSFSAPVFGDVAFGSSQMNQCIIRNTGSVVAYPSPVIGKYFYSRICEEGFSNWLEVLDCSDPAIYTAPVLTIPIWMSSFVGEFQLNNIPLDPMSKILNSPQLHPFTLRPSVVDTLNILGTVIASAVTGNIICNSSVLSFSGVGRVNGCDEFPMKRYGDLVGLRSGYTWV